MTTKLRVLILGVLVSLSAQATAESPKVSDHKGFDCSPLRLRSDDTLKITLPGNHGATLAIIDPQKRHWFIAYDAGSDKKLKPVISEGEFRKASSIVKKISEFKGELLEGSADKGHQKIFAKPGRYTVQVAQTLETEDPVLDGWCHLEYLGD